MAILIPSRTVLPGIEEALERAGIPVRVESQSLLFSTAEVRDLVSILAAIDDPTDEIAVVAALRSPAFGCSDADLAAYAMAGGRWDYRVVARAGAAGADDDDPVVAGLRALPRLLGPAMVAQRERDRRGSRARTTPPRARGGRDDDRATTGVASATSSIRPVRGTTREKHRCAASSSGPVSRPTSGRV